MSKIETFQKVMTALHGREEDINPELLAACDDANSQTQKSLMVYKLVLKIVSRICFTIMVIAFMVML